MSHFLDRLTFFNRVAGDFSDGYGITTRKTGSGRMAIASAGSTTRSFAPPMA